MPRKFSINWLLTALVVLWLNACVGGGGGGGSVPGPLGGPVGAPAGLPTAGDGLGAIDGGSSDGGTVVAMGAPEMPDVPVAPQLDIEDPEDKPRPVEFRIEGKVQSACTLETPKIRKKLTAQLLCRWLGTDDEFIPCGKGRYLRILDPVTHHYLDVQVSQEDSRFEWDFFFNIPDYYAKAHPFFSRHGLLLAKYVAAPENQITDMDPKSQIQYQPHNSGIGPQDDEPYDPPFDFGDTNDEADKKLLSDESDLKFYARSGETIPPSEIGIQKFCTHTDWCEPGQHGTHLYLGPMTLIDLALTEGDLPDSLPPCP